MLVGAALLCGCRDQSEPEPPEVPAIAWCEEVADWDPEWAAFELEVVTLVNEHRVAGASCENESFEAVAPVVMNPALRCAARKHALDMSIRDYFSGIDPDGVEFEQRAEFAEYEGVAIAQNIAGGQSTPAEVVQGWMASKGHCVNIMRPDATEIGLGYVPAEGVMWSSYWTQVFGREP